MTSSSAFFAKRRSIRQELARAAAIERAEAAHRRASSNRDALIAVACLYGGVALVVAAFNISVSFLAIAIAAYLARQAVVNQRRADSIIPRAAAADAAEGVGDMAEAA